MGCNELVPPILLPRGQHPRRRPVRADLRLARPVDACSRCGLDSRRVHAQARIGAESEPKVVWPQLDSAPLRPGMELAERCYEDSNYGGAWPGPALLLFREEDRIGVSTAREHCGQEATQVLLIYSSSWAKDALQGAHMVMTGTLSGSGRNRGEKRPVWQNARRCPQHPGRARTRTFRPRARQRWRRGRA